MRKITELKDNWFFVKNAGDVQEVAAWTGSGLSFAERRNSLWERNIFVIR